MGLIKTLKNFFFGQAKTYDPPASFTLPSDSASLKTQDKIVSDAIVSGTGYASIQPDAQVEHIPAPEVHLTPWEKLEEGRAAFTAKFLATANGINLNWKEGPPLPSSSRRKKVEKIVGSAINPAYMIAKIAQEYPRADTVAIWTPEGSTDYYKVQLYKALK